MPYSNLQTAELVRACVASADSEAWAEFVRRFQPTIAAAALRTTRRWGENSPLVVEDLVQETFAKLCSGEVRLLREFQSRHPKAILGYMKLITTRVVHDYFRQMHTVKRSSVRVVPMLADLESGPTDPVATERVEREVLLGEIERKLCEMDLGPYGERDRRIFWLYYRCGMTAQSIAAHLQGELTTGGVESVISRLTRLIREELAGSRYGTEHSGVGLPAQKGNGAK